MTADNEPFGAYRLSPIRAAFRCLGCALPPGGVARRVASLTRRLSIAGLPDPFDVEPFPGQRARLYPRDNLCEKRVFTAPAMWDAGEREELALAIESSRTDQPFVFIDAGSNVGLYTLFARSAAAKAKRRFRGLAIDAAPEITRRLRFNLEASGATQDVAVAEYALAGQEGEVLLELDSTNRGETKIGETGLPVRATTLSTAMSEARLDRCDALKIDVEGVEYEILAEFFQNAPHAMWPKLIIIEALSKDGGEAGAVRLCRENGYVSHRRTRMNVVLTLQ